MRKLLNYTIITLFAAYILYLFYSNRLSFYIHPRYTDFAVAMSWITVLFGLLYLGKALDNYWQKHKGIDLHVHADFKKGHIINWLILSIVLILGFGLQVQPLSAATAQQRVIDLNSLRSSEVSTADLFIRNTKNYSLGDWIVALNNNPDVKFYAGKEVNLSGFVFSPEDKQTEFYLSRFAITCCAVDARPIGLKVSYNWTERFRQNDWVAVEGKFILSDDSEYPELLIEPTVIEETAVPDEPYIF